MEVIEGLKLLALAVPRPGGLRHWGVDLLQVKLVLDGLLVDVRDHVRGLHEGHGKRGSHHYAEAGFGLRDREIHLEGLKVLAETTLRFERLEDDSALAVLLEGLEILEVDGEVLVVLVGLPQLLVHHRA